MQKKCPSNSYRNLFIILAFTLTACGGGGEETPLDEGALDAAPPHIPMNGGPCATDADCPEGGFCQVSGFSARSFCSYECDYVNDICHIQDLAGGDGTYIEGMRCIHMPDDFAGTGNPFCAPECDSVSDCVQYDNGFDTCAEPEHKGLPPKGFDKGSYKVCSQPPTDPEHPVDPITCDYKQQIMGFGAIKTLCSDYCDYLDACKEKPSDLSMACCGWGCFLFVTPGGEIDTARKNRIACFNNAFSGAQGTALVCTSPVDTCEPPIVARP